MTTYYTATFPNGTVLKRATASRKYTHAWFACGTRPPGDWLAVREHGPNGRCLRRIKIRAGADRYGATWSVSGFSGSEALARGALASWLGHSYYGQAGFTTDFSGIAPTVEVDRKASKATGEHAGQVTRPVKVMRAGRRSKTVAFVATLALILTTFGALVLGVVAHQTAAGKADKWTGTPRTGAVANLALRHAMKVSLRFHHLRIGRLGRLPI
jgi:hypothetical protein